MINVLVNAFNVVLEFFTSIFDSFFMTVPAFLEKHSNAFSDFLLGLMEFTGLSVLLSDITLFGLVFSLGIIAILVVYFFVP